MRPLDLESVGLTGRQKRKVKLFWQRFLPIFLGLFFIFILVKFAPLFWTLSQQTLFSPGFVFSFFTSSQQDLKSTNNRTNVLILGIGGAGHEGPDLSDTILVGSIDLTTFDVALISLPRDLWVDSLRAKINTAYAFGEEKKKGGGNILAQSVVSEVLGIPIHYVIRVDFEGFKKAVDLVGGVDIRVDKAFDDFEYPIEGKDYDTCGYTEKVVEIATSSAQAATSSAQKIIYLDKEGNEPPAGVNPYACRFEHLHFEAGLQHMDGARALQFVRSRKGTNGELGDFARSRRQQKLILALKEKIFSLETLLSPQKLNGLAQAFNENIDTNLKPEDAPKFYKLAQKVNFDKIRTAVLSDEGEDSLLVNPPPDQYNGTWVLIPTTGSWDQIHQFVQKMLFEPPGENVATPSAEKE